MNILCASLNSGVANDNLGSSFFRSSSSYVRGGDLVCRLTVGQGSCFFRGLNHRNSDAVYLLDVGSHLLQKICLGLIIWIDALFKVRLREKVNCQAEASSAVPVDIMVSASHQLVMVVLSKFVPNVVCHRVP